MSSLGSDNGVHVETRVKSDKAALVPDSQPQKVTVCDLAVAQQLSEVDVARVKQAVVIRKKGVLGVCRGLSKPMCDGRQRESLRVSGLRHDAQAAVLRQGARCPAVFNFLAQPLHGAGVMDVPCVEQGNQHIDVEEGAHEVRCLLLLEAD